MARKNRSSLASIPIVCHNYFMKNKIQLPYMNMMLIWVLATSCNARLFSEKTSLDHAQNLPTQVAISLNTSGDGVGAISLRLADSQEVKIVSNNEEWTSIFPGQTQISLTAISAIDSNFVGWSGDCTGHQATCLLTLQRNTSVVANFILKATAPTFPLLVNTTGNGEGIVVSAPGTITCGTLCQDRFSYGTDVTLTATPMPGSFFAGWQSSLCAEQKQCQFKLFTAASVTAIFSKIEATSMGLGKQLSTQDIKCPPRSFTLRWPVELPDNGDLAPRLRGHLIRWGTNPLNLDQSVYRPWPEDRPMEMSYHFVNLTAPKYYFSITPDEQSAGPHPPSPIITFTHPACP